MRIKVATAVRGKKNKQKTKGFFRNQIFGIGTTKLISLKPEKMKMEVRNIVATMVRRKGF